MLLFRFSCSSLAATSGFVLAAPLMAVAAAPSLEVDACLQAASTKHGIAYPLLRAIAETESSFNPNAVRRPFTAGGNETTDFGLMQINSGWLPMLAKHGISEKDLFAPCVSADIGAWILAQNFKSLGVTWEAVGAYNAVTPWKRVRYSTKVYNKLQKFLGAPLNTTSAGVQQASTHQRIQSTSPSMVVAVSNNVAQTSELPSDGMGVWESKDE